MLCNRCNERSATVHLTQIFPDKTVKQDLCGICGKEFVNPAVLNAHESAFKVPIIDEPVQVFKSLAKIDPRYTVNAYDFVCDGMLRAKKKRYGKSCAPGHISSAELLESLRELALEWHGIDARRKLKAMGISRCEDFGEIVFKLIKAGLAARHPTDSIADFQGGYDFATAFPT